MNQIKTVLSLFGGIEGGKMALDAIGIKPDLYLSSEIDPYPIQNTKHNYQDIVHIGNVTGLKYEDRALFHNQYNDPMKNGGSYIADIDLLIGGSPCQDVSNAGNQKGLAPTMEEYLERKKAGTATRSDLFWEFIRILDETKPKYFMLENVKMKKEYMEIFNKAIGFDADLIDAALLGPQHRKRLYWCGKRNPDWTYSKVCIPQPEDAGMKLKDILEDIPFDAVDEKGKPIWKPVPEKYIPIIQRSLEKGNKSLFNINPSGKGMNGNVFSVEGKAPTLTTNKGEGNKILLQIPHGNNNGHTFDEKVPSITTSKWQDNNKLLGQWRRTDIRIHADQEKVCTLTANIGTGGNNVPFICEQYMWRPLTVRECARCQGIPDSYEFVTKKTRSYKCIGNGWEARQIAHNFIHLLSA